MWSRTFRNLAGVLITLVAWKPGHAVSAWSARFRGRIVTTGAPEGGKDRADAAPHRSIQAQAKKTASAKRVAQDCTTTTGQPCKFPFTYHGTTYTGCTAVDGGTMWCSTQTDPHGIHIQGHWAGCLTGCPVHQHEAADSTENATSDTGSAASPGEEATTKTAAATTVSSTTASSTTVSSTTVTTLSSVSSTATPDAEPSSVFDGTDPAGSQFMNVRGSEFDVWLPGYYSLLTLTDVLYSAGAALLHVNGSLAPASACSKPMLLTNVHLTGARLHDAGDIHLYVGSEGRIGLGARGVENMTEAEFLNSVNTAKKTIVEFSTPPGADASGRVLQRRASIAVGDVSMRVDWYRNSGSGARYMDFSAWLAGDPRERVSGLLGDWYTYQDVIGQIPATCEDDLSESAELGSHLFATLGQMGMRH